MSAGRTKKRYMNLMPVIVFVLCLLLVGSNTVFAYPYLQLDAFPSEYDEDEESIVTTGPVFTLYALVNSEAPEWSGLLAETFYISVAIIPSRPETSPDPVLGSYILEFPALLDFPANPDSTTIIVAEDMDYGNPPINAALNPDELAAHGIFDTYYLEYAFTLDPGNTAILYNSMDDPGGPGPDPGSLYYQAFEVDASGLDSEYFLHFDLYTKDGLVVDKFAPFSHDVTHTPVPGDVLLGLLGLGVAGVKLRKFA